MRHCLLVMTSEGDDRAGLAFVTVVLVLLLAVGVWLIILSVLIFRARIRIDSMPSNDPDVYDPQVLARSRRAERELEDLEASDENILR